MITLCYQTYPSAVSVASTLPWVPFPYYLSGFAVYNCINSFVIALTITSRALERHIKGICYSFHHLQIIKQVLKQI